MAHLYFAGQRWNVARSDAGDAGHVAYAAALARVDQGGSLSLRIGRDRNGWSASQVETATPLGYGDYVFDVVGPIAALPATAMFTMGTYRNADSALLVRFSRHGWDLAKCGEFLVPGVDDSTARFRFAVPGGATETRHVIAWRPHQVTFSSFARSGDVLGGVIAQWAYRGDQVPSALTEHVRVSLSAERGSDDCEPCEVRLARFLFRRYTPVTVRRGGSL